MPFVPATPESHISLLSTPPHTCAGVTNLGTPCTRTLPQSAASAKPPNGVVTTVAKRTLYFCPKHQDQAENIVLRHTASFARRRAMLGRGSLDTLIERVEVLVGPDGTTGAGKGRKGNGAGAVRPAAPAGTKVTRKDELVYPAAASSGGSEEEGYLSSDGPHHGRPSTPPIRYDGKQPGSKKKKKKKRPFWLRIVLSCCCAPGSNDDDDDASDNDAPFARRRDEEKRWSEKQREAERRQAAAGIGADGYSQGRKGEGQGKKTVRMETAPPAPTAPVVVPKRPEDVRSAMKKTVLSDEDESESESDKIDVSKLSREEQKLLALIPSNLPRKAQAKLRTELLRPFSPKDEPGYIYVFWLTDSPLSPFSTPSPSTPSSTPPAHTPNILSSTSGGHRLSAYLGPHSNNNTTDKPKLLFKIGRAVNVQRRLHQWSTQCGYNLSLIRYYPHTSATSPAPPAQSPSYLNPSSHTSSSSSPALTSGGSPLGRKVPNVNRVERLIHLELGATPGANPAVECATCGKTHKEWFEVEASREGVLGVDAVIKKWIAFAEGGADAAVSVVGGGTQKVAASHTSSSHHHHHHHQQQQQQQQSGKDHARRPLPPKRTQAAAEGVPHTAPGTQKSDVKMHDRRRTNANSVPPNSAAAATEEEEEQHGRRGRQSQPHHQHQQQKQQQKKKTTAAAPGARADGGNGRKQTPAQGKGKTQGQAGGKGRANGNGNGNGSGNGKGRGKGKKKKAQNDGDDEYDSDWWGDEYRPGDDESD